MDSPQATEHLTFVNDILRRSEKGSPPALQFIAWGFVGIAYDLVGQLVALGKVGPGAFWAAGGVLAIVLAVSIWDLRRMARDAGRQSTIGRLAAFCFWTAAGVMTVMTVMNELTGLMPPFSPALFYASGMAIALLALGFGLRFAPLTLGGLALTATIVAAFLIPAWLGAILAFGNFAAFIVPGIFFAMNHDG